MYETSVWLSLLLVCSFMSHSTIFIHIDVSPAVGEVHDFLYAAERGAQVFLITSMSLHRSFTLERTMMTFISIAVHLVK